MNDTIDITINKPLYGCFVYIRDSYIKEAVKSGRKLRVIIPGQGEGIHDPVEWMKTGRRLEKVFKIPDHPMILWGNNAIKGK